MDDSGDKLGMYLIEWLGKLSFFRKSDATEYLAIQAKHYLESDCTVLFSNEDKAREHFIESSWPKVYVRYQSLEELKSHLYTQIHCQLTDNVATIHISGFSPFYKTRSNIWVTTNEKYGEIYLIFTGNNGMTIH